MTAVTRITGLIRSVSECPCLVSRQWSEASRKRMRMPSSIVITTRCFGHVPSRSNDENDDRDSYPNNVIDVTEMSLKMRKSVRDYTQRNKNIKLVGILAQPCLHADAELYSQHIAESCRQDSIEYEPYLVKGTEPRDVQEAIQKANSRPDVHGILVYYPLFKQYQTRGPYKNPLTGVYYKTFDDYLRDEVCPTKDVEGLCHDYNARWLFRARGTASSAWNNVVYPCTALSVLKILNEYHQKDGSSWKGIIVTIVNRSEIFGRPLATMLANAGATVYSIDIDSVLLFRPRGRMRRCTDPKVTLDWCLQQSHVVVTGVPSPDFLLPIESIQPGTTLVNVSEYANVNEERVLDSVPEIQYVPYVGKVTIAVLEQNLIQLHRQYHSEKGHGY